MEVKVRVMPERGHKPRNAGSLQKLEKARKPFLLSLQKKCSPDNTLALGLLTSRTVRW